MDRKLSDDLQRASMIPLFLAGCIGIAFLGGAAWIQLQRLFG